MFLSVFKIHHSGLIGNISLLVVHLITENMIRACYKMKVKVFFFFLSISFVADFPLVLFTHSHRSYMNGNTEAHFRFPKKSK